MIVVQLVASTFVAIQPALSAERCAVLIEDRYVHEVGGPSAPETLATQELRRAMTHFQVQVGWPLTQRAMRGERGLPTLEQVLEREREAGAYLSVTARVQGAASCMARYRSRNDEE